jgi:hypothetical protein
VRSFWSACLLVASTTLYGGWGGGGWLVQMGRRPYRYRVISINCIHPCSGPRYMYSGWSIKADSLRTICGNVWGLRQRQRVTGIPAIVGCSFVFCVPVRRLSVPFHLACVSYMEGRPLWSSGQSSWLLTQRSRVRFQALPDFLSGSGSGTGSTQPL